MPIMTRHKNKAYLRLSGRQSGRHLGILEVECRLSFAIGDAHCIVVSCLTLNLIGWIMLSMQIRCTLQCVR